MESISDRKRIWQKMEKNVHLIRWFGPIDRDKLKDWEESHPQTFNLYMISGRMKGTHAQTVHYYIGMTEQASVTQRYDSRHHINEFREIHEIWVGTITNRRASRTDIKRIEKFLIRYFSDTVGKERMRNAIDFIYPDVNVYIISEWIKPDTISEEVWKRRPRLSPANILPDVLVCRNYDQQTGYVDVLKAQHLSEI